ncbi:MAG: phytanoyl-CoA dioxygenase family protein [Planctomycetia bacterium]|nr:phytanoyl-CoA dioxygenase family protein [Planctomycetia bacterium]
MTTRPAAWRSAFDRDGYLALPGFLSPLALHELVENVDRFLRDVVPAMPREHVFYEAKDRPDTLKQLQLMQQYDAYFGELIEKGRFADLAATLLADDVLPINVQYFNKPPGAGQPTPAHQDGYYFMLAPCEAVTIWLALEGVDEENGCVRYVRGSHRHGVRPHGRTQTLGFSQGITDYPRADDLANETPMPAQPGDALAHHALTIHRAEGNRSAIRTRRAVGFIYYAARAKADAEANKAYESRLVEELKTAGKL